MIGLALEVAGSHPAEESRGEEEEEGGSLYAPCGNSYVEWWGVEDVNYRWRCEA